LFSKEYLMGAYNQTSNFLVAIILGLAIGCSGGEGDPSEDISSSQDSKKLQNDQRDQENLEDQGNQSECPGLPDLSDRYFKIDMLEASEPTTELNSIWAQDIAEFELNLVFHIVSHDMEDNILDMRISAASAVKEGTPDNPVAVGFNFALEPYEFQAKLEGCKFVISPDDPVFFDIVNETLTAPIKVEGISGYGEFSPDGTKIVYGDLSGYIALALAEGLCMTIPGIGTANFHWFMNLARICPNMDTDEDGELDGYFFSGIFSAQHTTLMKEGIVPIEIKSDECEPHQEICLEAP
jgi:hypothetical protein